MNRDLTMPEILTDPLIGLMRKADGIASSDFSDLLHAVAERLKAQYKGTPTGTSLSVSIDQLLHAPVRTLHEKANRSGQP